jgi:hypothetical protein
MAPQDELLLIVQLVSVPPYAPEPMLAATMQFFSTAEFTPLPW